MPASKRCLILAAGFGTRMGDIGKQLPKVMWPVFGQPLLELQLRFAQRLGYEDIWINLHHQADIISARVEKNPAFKNVRWLHETPEILDIGGAIHNLAAQPEVNYQGELLVLNADQFLWFTAEDLTKWKQEAGAWDVLLLNWSVNTSQSYNQVLSDDQRNFLRVVKNAELPRNQVIETYSGNSLVHLDGLERITGVTPFFESVCVPAKHQCKTALLSEGRYWDFGTAARYWKSMQEILQAKAAGVDDPFLKFLDETGAFRHEKFFPKSLSYNSQTPNLIHLGEGSVPTGHPSGVILEGKPLTQTQTGPCLVFNGINQAL